MAESHVISGLTAKRSEVAGHILKYEQQIAALRCDLAHLDATIKLFDPEFNLRGIRAKKIRTRNRFFENGECHRLMLEALRDCGGRASTGQLAATLVVRKGLGEEHLNGVHHTLDGALRRAAASGAVVAVGKGEHGNLWQLPGLPQ